MSASSATLVVSALSVQTFRRKLAEEHGRWNCEGLGYSSCLSEVGLEFMVQQAGCGMENCLGKVKGRKKEEAKYGKPHIFSVGFCCHPDNMLEKR